MKLKFVLPLLAAVLPWAFTHSLQRTEDSALARRGDREVLDSYARQGLCFSYTGPGPLEKSIEPCKTWCAQANEGDSGTHGCNSFIPGGIDDSITPKFRDDDGNEYMVGTCLCDAPFADIIAELVVAGLSRLDNILCAVMVTALKEVAEMGLMFVPGGAVVKGAEGSAKAIRYAKSAYENGMDADSFFDGWVGHACGVKDWDFDLDSMFTDMVDAPDSLMGEGVSSTGCALKDKSKCRKRDKKPDPKTSSQVHRGTMTTERQQVKRGTRKSKGKTSTAKTKEKTTSSTTKEKTSSSTTKKKTSSSTTKVNASSSTAKQKTSSSATTEKTSTRTSTSTGGPASTTKPPACKIKRAPYVPEEKRLVGKFGEVEKRITEECENGKTVTVHHWTSTDPAIGHYIQDRKDMAKVTCKAAHTQACYHYRSVMNRYKGVKDMTEWTCQQTTTMHDRNWGWDGTATDDWGSTAIAKQRGQHWWPWANGFVLREVDLDDKGQPRKNKKGNDIIRDCERDEFPPRYFWPEQKKVPKHMRQLVRFLPGDQNGGAGGLWAGFCNENNAASTKQAKGKTYHTYVVSKNLKSKQKAAPITEALAGKDKTIHSSVEVETLRAIFSIAGFEGLQPLPEDGLRDNPCYPSDLVDDPGWALLTDDPWYHDAANAQHRASATLYQKAPDVQKVRDALARGGVPRWLFQNMPDIQAVRKRLGLKDEKKMWKAWVGDGNGQIPQDLWGLLPGLPAFPKPKRRRWSLAELQAANGTHHLLGVAERSDDNGDGIDWDGGEDDVDTYSDEELERWLDDYRELADRLYADADADDGEARNGAEQMPPWWPSPTAPPEVEAESTPLGQGETTPTPALAASKVTDEIPGPTN